MTGVLLLKEENTRHALRLEPVANTRWLRVRAFVPDGLMPVLGVGPEPLARPKGTTPPLRTYATGLDGRRPLRGSPEYQLRRTGWPEWADSVAASARRRAAMASSMPVGGVVPASTASMKALSSMR